MSVLNPAYLSDGLQRLFPEGCVVAELRSPGEVALLLPAEAACLGRSVPMRAREFAAGRLCARRALSEFGIEGFAVLAAVDRQPQWPESMVGSITHTEGLAAAVAAERRRFTGLGLDTEVVARVTPNLWPKICRPLEREWLYSLPEGERLRAAALIFAAKEAFYKCQYPLTGEWLDFQDLEIEALDWPGAIRGEAETCFRIAPVRAIALAERAALPAWRRCRFHGDFVSAGVAIAADQ